MQIAFLIDRYIGPRAGTERQLWLLSEELAVRGHTVRLGVLRAASEDAAALDGFPGAVDVLNVSKIADPRSFWRIFRWGRRLKRMGFAFVQIYFNDASLLGPWTLRLAGLRVIISRRDMGFWYAGTRWLPLLRAAGKAVDLVVANSHAAGRAACERERLPSSKLRIIYNGLVSLPRRPAASAGPDIGSGPSGGRVGIVANARPVKRVEDLVRAFTRVRAGGRDCDLAIVGRVTPSVAALVNASSLREQVHMPGQVEDAIAWIRTFDVGVICSESEGLSNALLEYMQCGVAVVATATGGNVELVEHEQTGLLVAVADTDGLAAALERLLADEPLRRRLGEAGRAFVASRFSITEMVDAHEGLYRTLSGSPDRLAASHNA